MTSRGHRAWMGRGLPHDSIVPMGNSCTKDISIRIELSMLDDDRRGGYNGGMRSGVEIAEIGALIGDPARANMLLCLLDGRPRTATELAYVAGISPQTGSWHLGSLTRARLLLCSQQGRYRYYRLASPLVARLLETMMTVASLGQPRHRPASKIDDALRTARTCYDHLAGRLGVALADMLSARGQVRLNEEGGEVTAAGARFLSAWGVDLAKVEAGRRAFCRPCLDWSERRPHLAGALGAALAERCFGLGWIERMKETRAVAITPKGRRGLADSFGIVELA